MFPSLPPSVTAVLPSTKKRLFYMKTLSLLSLVALFIGAVAFVQPDADLSKQQDFKAFLAEFEATDLPYQISVQDLQALIPSSNEQQRPADNVLGRKYIDFLPELKRSKFSRMPPADIIAVNRFEINKNLIAVVYKKFMPFHRASHEFYMATYNRRGQFLDKNWLASFHPSTTMSCTVNADGSIISNVYDNVWEKPVSEVGMLDNTLVNHEIRETQYYKIAKDGKFVEMKESPYNGRASLK